MERKRNDTSCAQAMTPQQRMRMALPRQRKFTVELAGWPEQRRFMILRRCVFAAYVGLVVACAAAGGFLSVPGAVPHALLLAALAGFVAGGVGFVAMRTRMYLAGMLAGGMLLGFALGTFGGTGPEQLAWVGTMLGLPLAGHVLNGLFWRSAPSPFKQFLAWLPWLAAGTAWCWYAGAETAFILFLGIISNLIVFIDIFTLDASMRFRGRTEIVQAAGDLLYLPFLAGRLADDTSWNNGQTA